MSAINFSGMSSGIETESIVKELMEAERQPLERLAGKKEDHEARLEAYKEYHEKLEALNSAAGALGSQSDVNEQEVSLSDEGVVSASADGAAEGSYQVTVDQLAQVQKSLSEDAYESQDDQVFGTGEIELEVGEGVVSDGASGTVHTVEIAEGENSLAGIRDAINEETGEHGLSATITDNGSEDGDRYQLMLTGEDGTSEFKMNSNLSGGDESLALQQDPVQSAQEAVVQFDGVEITSSTNTIKDPVEGMTLDLEGESPENADGMVEPTTVTVETDKEAIVSKMEKFVSAYNDTVSFVTGQSDTSTTDGGVLGGESSVNSVKRRLQNMLTTPMDGNDNYTTLSQLGLSTNKDGTINFDSAKMESAMADDFSEVARLMGGDDDTEGIFGQYGNYLSDTTSSIDGLYATRKDSINRQISQIDSNIERTESRLERREERLYEKFASMEEMISEMNSQGDYLEKQMDKIPSIGGK